MIDGFLVAKLISFWLFGFSTLITIINPFGIAFVFHDMTRWLTARERARLARQIGINSFVVLVVALFLGSRVLSFFGISLEALRIGGGLAVAASGWTMLRAQPEASKAPQAMDTAPIERMAFFPLTLPLTTGPGSIAASIALGAERTAETQGVLLVSAISSVLVAASVAACVWIAYAYSEAIARRIGPQGTLVATKLTAFLLLCIGVQIILTGVTDALRLLLAARA
ncbi:MarC family protein [Roseomonas sp. HF4]|uniref:MarC family protein n=1 Tax=Roseomonas sp. HF4 TaxID=2562313 RepID=UPI0010C0C7BE|nr:NAAT family transporter [Roseomonas sp. HF4]